MPTIMKELFSSHLTSTCESQEDSRLYYCTRPCSPTRFLVFSFGLVLLTE